MGYGIICQDGSHLKCITSGSISAPKGLSLEQRLLLMYQGLETILHQYGPAHAAVESIFAFKNVKSSLTLAHARGVALMACAKIGIEVAEYSPMEVKLSAVGHGHAGKEQVSLMMRRLFNLAAPTAKTKIDTTDAIAVALCHLQHLQTKRKTLSSVVIKEKTP